MSLEELKSFFGWCTVLGFGLLVLSTLGILCCRGWAHRLHGKLFGLDARDLDRAYFQYLANLKIAVLVLGAIPWLALTIMS